MEARKWIEKYSNKYILGRNPDVTKEELLEWVDNMYQSGATEVIVPKYEGKETGNNTLVITLPKGSEIYNRLTEILNICLFADEIQVIELASSIQVLFYWEV